MITSPAVLVALVVFPPVSLGELLLILSVFSGVRLYWMAAPTGRMAICRHERARGCAAYAVVVLGAVT